MCFGIMNKDTIYAPFAQASWEFVAGNGIWQEKLLKSILWKLSSRRILCTEWTFFMYDCKENYKAEPFIDIPKQLSQRCVYFTEACEY